MFDKDECGKILAAELRHVLLALGERLTKDEVDEMMKGVEDAEGNVNYDGEGKNGRHAYDEQGHCMLDERIGT